MSGSSPFGRRNAYGAVFLAVIVFIAAGLFVWSMESGRSGEAEDPRASPYIVPSSQVPVPKTVSLPASPKLLVMGDNLASGTGTLDPQTAGFAPIVGSTLGWEFRVDAETDTGWTWGGLGVGVGPDRYAERLQRFADMAGFVPDIIFLQGGQYDFRSGLPGIEDAVRDSVFIARSRWPNVQVVILGPVVPMPGGSSYRDINSAVRRGAFEAGTPFIDGSSWLNWVNSSRFGSLDGENLTEIGHQFVADKFLEAFSLIGGPKVR